MPDLRKRDLHEILKWGRWRTYYRPGTALVRQGEEAHYVGLVLQGKLALYTEDEITRSKQLVTYVHKYDLVGSEDFSSKFRTARRTIQMPRFVEPDPHFSGPAPGVEVPPQLLPETLTGEELVYPTDADPQSGNLKEAYMYQNMTKLEALTHLCTQVLAKEERDHLAERMDTVWGQGTATPDPQSKLARLQEDRDGHDDGKRILVTTIPAVIFTWDIKDLKRLMLADPHVESSLSTLLRSDITFKLNAAAPTAPSITPG